MAVTEVEICVADPAGAAASARGGADRVELCAALEVGGLTPSMGTVELTRELAGEVFVTALIRPRAGDFVYDRIDTGTMLRDVSRLAAWADSMAWPRLGFTVGALTPDGEPDAEILRGLAEAAGGRPLVFHKAFDAVPHPEAALALLAAVGIEAVLTSGGGGACVDNLDRLRRLAQTSPVTVVAAGGVRAHNVAAVAATGVGRVHLRAGRPAHSLSRVASEYDAETREETSDDVVGEVVALVRGAGR